MGVQNWCVICDECSNNYLDFAFVFFQGSRLGRYKQQIFIMHRIETFQFHSILAVDLQRSEILCVSLLIYPSVASANGSFTLEINTYIYPAP